MDNTRDEDTARAVALARYLTFTLNVMDYVVKIMNFVSKMMDSVLKW